MDRGYTVTLIKGVEFDQVELFNEYINEFYSIKRNSEGAQRYIAKMHWNSLYGNLGRKQEQIQTLNVHNDNLKKSISYTLREKCVRC